MDYQVGNIEIDKLVEIINNELYFAVMKGTINRKMRSTVDTFYFSIEDELTYHNYYCDFGPLNISCLYKYCVKLNKYLTYAKGIKRVVHYTTSNEKKKANAAYLIGSFAVIYLKFHPDNVSKILYAAGPFKNFVDASQCPSMYRLQIVDCLHAIYKALAFNFFNFTDFNPSEYDTRNTLQFGDLNWLVPRKFLAFIGPTENEFLNGHPPEFYIKYFLQNDVKTVIRLNNKFYDSTAFKKAGIDHYDLIFPDGSTPPKDILFKFLDIVENAPAVVAVHCKAGLGRTGSLIGAYLLKHYKMTAKEAIAWMRICRPGSVIGHQQNWLEKLEKVMWNLGADYRNRLYGDPDKILYHKYGIYSKKWPIEREKMIREARRKIQSKFTQSQCETLSQTHNSVRKSPKLNKPEKKSIKPSTDRSTLKEIMKMITRNQATEECTNNVVGDANIEKASRSTSICNSVGKKVHCPGTENKNCPKHSYIEINRTSSKKTKCTQGDKLNDIKAQRQTSPEKVTKFVSSQKLSVLYEKHKR